MTDKLLRIVKQLEANRQLAFEARMAAIRADDAISEIGREAYNVLQEIARACHCDEADLGAAKYRRETCPVHGRPEAPATSCRGCNHERHPSLACGACERAGHVCTGLATHRSVRTAPAAQAGLPAAEVVVTTEHASEWSFGEIVYQRVTQSLAIPSRAKLIAAVEADIRANLSRVQAEHDREREADRRRVEELETKLAELARATRVYLSLCSCEMLQGPEVDIEDALAQAESDGPAKPAPWQATEQSTIADLRRQLAEAKRERADYGDKMTARTGELENELATLRAWKEGAMAVMAEWDGLRKLVEDGSPAQLGRGLAENTERVIRDLRAKVDELESGARVARLVEANRKLKAKVERRTWLVEQALEGRRSNWTLSQWFDWEHTALAELATDAQ